jgi:long-subunit acyl-CoA synthetase (AMP-forming)/nucleoside-diphosphate-sugar epimerase/1-acyl-sn-glycerol-3-phosphate acyltransferase/acyl carrier protein
VSGDHELSIPRALAGKRVLVTGATGFLGKVFVSKLLHDAPDVARVTCVVRKGKAASALARLEEEIVRSPALSPVPEGRKREKLLALEGDTGLPRFGLSEEAWDHLATQTDLVVHCAGVVDFSPPLDEAISVNVDGTIAAIALARRAQAPLLHVSTCYVSGCRDGSVQETLEVGDHPDRERTGFAGFDASREVEICRGIVERILRERDDASIVAAHLRDRGGDLAAAKKAALDRSKARLREEGKERARRWGFPNSYTYSKGLAEQLVETARARGEVRACVVRPAILESALTFPFPGWNQGANTTAPLVYMTYRGHRFFPLREGNFLDILPIDMCAGAMVAIAAAHLRGRAERCYHLGSGDTNVFHLARVMELTALYYRRRPVPGWNPIASLGARRFLEATGVSERLYNATSLPLFANAARLVARVAERLDGAREPAAGAATGDEVVRERRRGLARALRSFRRSASDTEKMIRKTAQVIEEYLPFIHGPRPVYQTRHARALRAALPEGERALMLFEPESIDWRRYWHEVHLPGMERWTFPELDRLAARAQKRAERKDAPKGRGPRGSEASAGAEAPAAPAPAARAEDAASRSGPFPHHASSQTLAAISAIGGGAPLPEGGAESQAIPVSIPAGPLPLEKERADRTAPVSGGEAPPRADTLLDLLAGVVARDGSHAALEDISAKEALARVAAGARRLRARGVRPGDRVAFVSENSPAWVIGYLAILAAGATAVPLDAALAAREVATLVRLSRARLLYASPRRRAALEGAGLEMLPLEALAATPASDGTDTGPGPGYEGAGVRGIHLPSDVTRDPEAPASLIYTSGTTGAPKGVLLPHRAFCSQVAALSRLYVLGPDDRVLSVLPAHHAFEFTCGLMLPLASGATVHFAAAATPEAVRAALRRVRPTAMIAVPALLEAFLRTIRREVRARGDFAARAFETAVASHRRLRDATGRNLGRTLFAPAHDAFGGSLRLLVSGGASLPAAAFEAFRGMGFDIYEGFGLTEAGPVVTTCRPGRAPRAGSVGEPIPGTQVRLARLRKDGTGEVEVSGPGLTLGYDENPAATAAIFGEDGWLRTGDLGRLDEDGTLAIVGRVKDVIVDGAGNTVYPDEVEEAYAGAAGVAELAVARVRTPDGKEVVGALVLAKEGAREEEVLAALRAVDATLPFPKRAKVVRFAAGALPRTATRKVKREEVSRMLASLLEGERAARAHEPPAGALGTEAEAAAGLKARRMVAELAGLDVAAVALESRLAEDLGLDSLAQVELAGALAEETGRALKTDRPLEGVATVADVARLLTPAEARPPTTQVAQAASDAAPVAERGIARREAAPREERPREPARAPAPPVELPGFVKQAGNALLTFLQRKAYEGPLRAEVTGRANIPRHVNALIVANHSSHLDLGLVKHALGDYGRHAASLGARDYFFSTPLRRLYFESFTEVMPFDRRDTSREKLDEVVGRLAGGDSVIIFPEGTRSTSGTLGSFRSGLGYLVLKSRIGVLPMWLEGTHEALPKGASVLRARDLAARIGRYLPYEELAQVAEGRNRHEAYKAIGAYVRAAVERLRDGAPDLEEEERGRAWARGWDAARGEGKGEVLGAGAGAGEGEGAGGGGDPLDAPPAGEESMAIPVPAQGRAQGEGEGNGVGHGHGQGHGRGARETPEERAARLVRSLPERHRPGRIGQSKTFYVKFGEGEGDRYTIRLAPERCEVIPGKGAEPADCVVRAAPAVLERLIEEGDGPSFEDIALGNFKTNDPDALRLLVEALGLGERAVR